MLRCTPAVAAVLVSPLVVLTFEMVLFVAEVSGLRERPTGQRATVEFDFGTQLVAWNSFATTYLLLGSVVVDLGQVSQASDRD